MKLTKACSALGCCLLLLPTGIQWYWGQMGTYVLSYYHKQSSAITGTESRWTTSIFLICRVISLIAGAYLIRLPCKRFIVILGIIVFNAGIFTSYFAVSHSIAMLTFTLGGVCGLGTGVLYAASLELSMQWANKDEGLLVSLLQCSYTFGAIIIIQFMALYANPRNLTPNQKSEHYVFFGQDEIINRVPAIFLIFSVSSLVIQIIGICLIREKQPISPEKEKLKKTNKENGPVESQSPKKLPANTKPSRDQGFTVKEMLQTRSFYVIWVTHLLGNCPYLILTNDYKAFGQLYIKDDHFLSVLGSAVVIISIVMKVAYGIISDKIGFKIVLISVFSIMTVSTAFMYSAPFVNKWLYFAITLILGIPSGTILTSHTIATVQLFGSRNVAVNTGLMSSASVVILLAAPPLTSAVLEVSGWSNVFLGGAFLSLISLLLIVLCL